MLSVRLHLAVLILCSVNVDCGRVIFKSTVLGLAIHGSRETGRFPAIISVNSRENKPNNCIFFTIRLGIHRSELS